MPKRAMADKKESKPVRSFDALQLLKQDHQRVARLFEECIAAPLGGRGTLAQQIFHELELHTALEEELFYPALERELNDPSAGEAGYGGLNGTALLNDENELDAENEDEDVLEDDGVLIEERDDVIATAYEDHRAVKHMIERMRTMDVLGEEFQSVMAELQNMVRYHIDEEEEVIFPEARLALDIVSLGQQMQERKQELLASQ